MKFSVVFVPSITMMRSPRHMSLPVPVSEMELMIHLSQEMLFYPQFKASAYKNYQPTRYYEVHNSCEYFGDIFGIFNGLHICIFSVINMYVA